MLMKKRSRLHDNVSSENKFLRFGDDLGTLTLKMYLSCWATSSAVGLRMGGSFFSQHVHYNIRI